MAKYLIRQGLLIMKSRIIGELEKIENDNDVTVLYACESGSRAWGFNREDSDYDVRFIYKRNNRRDYLTLSEKSDVIEVMDGDFDIVGWDVKKALYLHYRNNPNLREWILSPIKYIDWRNDIFKGLPDFDSSVLKFHYTNIALNNWKILKNKTELSKRAIKMYMYNSRSVLVWMIINEGKNPPINIFDLLNQADSLDEDIKDDINTLVRYYKNGCVNNLDLNLMERINKWMDEYISIMRKDFPKKEVKPDLKIYDDRFFDIIFPDFKD